MTMFQPAQDAGSFDGSGYPLDADALADRTEATMDNTCHPLRLHYLLHMPDHFAHRRSIRQSSSFSTREVFADDSVSARVKNR
jgi:hypothetical protein